MNLRIAPEHIRFRITEAEFNTLTTHGVLINSTTLSGTGRLDYVIRIHPDAANSDGQALQLTTQLRSDAVVLEISLFADGLKQLQSGIGSKEGVQAHLAFDTGAMLTIGLEIDLHSKQRAHA